ncbi:MAG TPA: hypothetical protein VFQ96_00930 [Microbacteriaceae bacterium]|nr:hypothetical protein [Microbacteriaceae bacterium]
MPVYTRRRHNVTAYRWAAREHGSHPAFVSAWETAVEEDKIHPSCGRPWREHAVTTDEHHQIVCPGQWAVNEIDGTVRVLDDHDFHDDYEAPEELAS